METKQEEDSPVDHWMAHRSTVVEDPPVLDHKRLTFAALSPQSIGTLLQDAFRALSPITECPRLEAEVLLAHLLDVPRATLLAHPERKLGRRDVAEYQSLVAQRSLDYPLPYLTGEVEFYGLPFEVSPEVLIPRPATETLVDLALDYSPNRVIDVGTGSGCIAVALALYSEVDSICAIDISSAALAVAQRNVERHGVSEKVDLIAGDVLCPRPERADLIVSNPPYVAAGEEAALPPSVRNHEPRVALDGGLDGMDVIRKLLAQAPGVLHPNGAILIEIGATQGERSIELARTYYPDADICVHPDLAGRDRVLAIQT